MAGWILFGAFLLLVAVVLVRTFLLRPQPHGSDASALVEESAPPPALERLSGAIQIPTVSHARQEDTDFSVFDAYIAYMQEAFPLFHQRCSLERVNGYGLVYRWQGKDVSLPPLMLTAHYDVVPLATGTEKDWKYPGFSGKIAEGRVWGRGTLDIKSQMTAHMEAAESLMKEGFVPQRDCLFVYGHDEEVDGLEGALKIAEYFQQKNILLDSVLDEGGIALYEAMPGIKPPLALIGVAEKGYCDYELTTLGSGGHSSMPPNHTALGHLSRLICRVENHPMPARITGIVEGMLRNIACEMGFMVRMAVANLWLFRPLLLKVLKGSPATAAMIRTTFAATMCTASNASNVLPAKATATVNVRLLPGDTSSAVRRHILALQKEPVEIAMSGTDEPSEISPMEGPAYERLLRCVNSVFPMAIATPYLVMGGTDARKYSALCRNIYRFTPALITNEEKDSMHNINESIRVEEYGRMIRFFELYLREYDKPQ